MLSIAVAFRIFFRALFDREASNRLAEALGSESQKAIVAKSNGASASEAKVEKKPARPAPPIRSDAIAIVELLQREARLVDFLMESLDDYSDEQVGVAVRDVHRGCRELLDRVFALQPIVEDDEGETFEVPDGYSAAEYRVVGQLSGKPPYHGELLHHGWRASQLKLPKWSGSDKGHLVVAPAEVEIKSA